MTEFLSLPLLGIGSLTTSATRQIPGFLPPRVFVEIQRIPPVERPHARRTGERRLSPLQCEAETEGFVRAWHAHQVSQVPNGVHRRGRSLAGGRRRGRRGASRQETSARGRAA